MFQRNIFTLTCFAYNVNTAIRQLAYLDVYLKRCFLYLSQFVGVATQCCCKSNMVCRYILVCSVSRSLRVTESMTVDPVRFTYVRPAMNCTRSQFEIRFRFVELRCLRTVGRLHLHNLKQLRSRLRQHTRKT